MLFRSVDEHGGRIDITTQNVDLLKPQLHGRFAVPPGRYVRVAVADQGCGVPESLRDKIFEQGVSTRADEPGEHGIGLYLIASYVTRCGGVITLEDNDPCGTLFSIYIPKVKPNDSSINPIDR